MGEPLGMTKPNVEIQLTIVTWLTRLEVDLRDLGYRVNDNNDRQNSRMLSISDPNSEDHQIIELSFARTPFTVTFSRFTLQGVVGSNVCEQSREGNPGDTSKGMNAPPI